jgi:hypothetical protein
VSYFLLIISSFSRHFFFCDTKNPTHFIPYHQCASFPQPLHKRWPKLHLIYLPFVSNRALDTTTLIWTPAVKRESKSATTLTGELFSSLVFLGSQLTKWPLLFLHKIIIGALKKSLNTSFHLSMLLLVGSWNCKRTWRTVSGTGMLLPVIL